MPLALPGRRHITMLNTDGARHPMENSLAVISMLLGLTAIVLGLIVRAHMFGAFVGLIGFPVALYSQMVSVTSGERWLNIIGMIASFVGLALSLAHGGFTP
ncbi:hypothetical protein [Actinomadura alba]|uniref:Uncharacterized protein n=1 Tax=Actinomadura alba TaxID=406431 RepID=A0ABR7LN41_9ACTN|nr:hypothetical protein [Actinomadura alba]MBC6466155.1 hypothetical protein [Actinomadura alba]